MDIRKHFSILRLNILQGLSPVRVEVLFIPVNRALVMHQVPVTIHTSFLIAGPGVEDRFVSQHGAPLVWNIEKVAVTLQALII